MEEIVKETEVKNERQLHREIGNLLRLKGVFFVESRMDRKTTTQVGVPDFLFSVLVWIEDKLTQTTIEIPQAQAWELKVNGRPLDPEQQKAFETMSAKPNGWSCRVIRSVDQALEELRKIGL